MDPSSVWIPGANVPFHVWGYYGVAGTKGDTLKATAGERLLELLFDAAALLGAVPIALCGDFNVNPEGSLDVFKIP